MSIALLSRSGSIRGAGAVAVALTLAAWPVHTLAAQSPTPIDGPPPPVSPSVIRRDATGRATVRAIKLSAPLVLDGILDEDGVRAVVGRGHLQACPAREAQGCDIRIPLRPGQIEIDRGAVEVGDDALGQARTGRPDKGESAIHTGNPATLCRWPKVIACQG